MLKSGSERKVDNFLHQNLVVTEKNINFALANRGKMKILFKETKSRGVAQPGLEYASGGRVVASSNLVTPT